MSNKYLRYLATLILNSCLVQISLGQTSDLNFPPPENQPVVKAFKTTEKITLDGLLDEADWKRARPRSEPAPARHGVLSIQFIGQNGQVECPPELGIPPIVIPLPCFQ